MEFTFQENKQWYTVFNVTLFMVSKNSIFKIDQFSLSDAPPSILDQEYP